ncbi:PepSY domain-containing protein [Flavobacterium psychrophilum]|uniref:PepSY domain-containing protein n=1 Tax=Flavobacterium psychrophilum TaxID=96345 RepID=UPI00073F5616|nr:PepSY domain-containing protein [Flavobacterium psychrophilum]EKT4518909.1 PepSY domain-containing protein [Flavobacterium psychrophilum]ELY2016975.1 PepSY domain-containing protein [Flavobacterium psychrophilum]GAQ47857.1 hypothetical protein FPK15_contig00002-0022 [Flavobacterium psychrophilum]SNB95616.1 conserved membrane hypothetical protein [Flavobacterium psychrophilum]
MKTENQFKKKDSKFVKKIKQNMYRWHRILGLITLVPVIFWTLSGIMHPFMAHFFKPEIAHEKLELKPIDHSKIKLSLQEVLARNEIHLFKNFRIIDFKNQAYYQIKSSANTYRYFDAKTAKELGNGDQKYAEYLSRYFIDDLKSTVSRIELVTKFTTQYKYINRYLPVYKLTFNRDDAMQVYVETSSSKLANYNPRSRQIFVWIFDTFHNWGFIDAIANNYLRIIIMLLLLFVISFSAISGIVIYGFLWKKFKKVTPINSEGFLRKNHQKIGIMVSFLTLTFAFSGGYHAMQKWEPNVLPKMIYEPIINVSDIKIASTKTNVDWSKLTNISVIKFKKDYYYQCDLYDTETEKTQKKFINANTNILEKNIEIEYAQYLVFKFKKMLLSSTSNCCDVENSETFNPNFTLKTSAVLTDFDKREYGFVNKRLPVVKLEYNSDDGTTYYIETSTSRLASIINNDTRREGYSFAIFHKFLLMEWAGRNIRDFMTIISALGILVVSVLGLILFMRRK